MRIYKFGQVPLLTIFLFVYIMKYFSRWILRLDMCTTCFAPLLFPTCHIWPVYILSLVFHKCLKLTLGKPHLSVLALINQIFGWIIIHFLSCRLASLTPYIPKVTLFSLPSSFSFLCIHSPLLTTPTHQHNAPQRHRTAQRPIFSNTLKINVNVWIYCICWGAVHGWMYMDTQGEFPA